MTENDSVLTNQTQFSYEEPYRQAESVIPGEDQKLPAKPGSKRLRLVAVGAAVFVVLIVLLAVAVRRPEVTQNAPFQQGTVVIPEPQAVNPLRERIDRLELELQDADPVKQPLLFPPLDMNIRLDPK